MLSYSIIASVLLGLAAADENYDVEVCNGESCNVNLVDTQCTVGSCVGEGGGDGAKCHVMKGWGPAYCPVNCDKYYCP
ncbi:hypothetical protein LA080_001920 [Diaporthe eres]|nr:hypothetical protein LA080_001920 [Diaporthe eres]